MTRKVWKAKAGNDGLLSDVHDGMLGMNDAFRRRLGVPSCYNLHQNRLFSDRACSVQFQKW